MKRPLGVVSSVLFVAATAVLASGCGSEESVDQQGDPDAGEAGCPDGICLMAPARGFQLRNVGLDVYPGEDVEYCEVVRLPGTATDKYYVNRFEAEMTPGSHHLIVAGIIPGSETEANAPVGTIIDCIGPTAFGEDLNIVTTAQLPTAEVSYPAGVGREYQGGQLVLFNYHYLNATDAPLKARAAINFHTVAAADIEHIVNVMAVVNIGFSVPAQGTSSVMSECLMNTDVMVHKLSRHTHQWGTEVPVWYVGGERDGQLIYTSPNYEDPDHTFDEPVLVKAGEGFRFECNWNNTTDAPLGFGFEATNEMCILFGDIYSPINRNVSPQGCFFQ